MAYKYKKSKVEWQKKWQNKRRRLWKKRISEYKKKIGKCKECGWNVHPEILEPHHRDPNEKKFQLGAGNIGCRSWVSILKELQKCDFLCPNCHRWFHFNELEKFTEFGKNSLKKD